MGCGSSSSEKYMEEASDPTPSPAPPPSGPGPSPPQPTQPGTLPTQAGIRGIERPKRPQTLVDTWTRQIIIPDNPDEWRLLDPNVAHDRAMCSLRERHRDAAQQA